MKTIGVDVGGTNTDAVLVNDDGTVLHECKTLTTKDVISGVKNALTKIVTAKGDTDDIGRIMIGTTHFLNAVLQRKSIEKTATIRISAPTARTLFPTCDWPEDLAKVIYAGHYIVEGGHEFSGLEIMPINEAQIRDATRQIKADGIRCICISSPFSTMKKDHEIRAREIVLQEIPDALISISSDVGKIGLLERENVAILNASLLPLAEKTISSFENALKEINLDIPLYITQNDGTITSAQQAKMRPVSSFASGPTNSMRGAVFLSGIKDAVVCDVGGTTSDLGVVANGFPREANNVVEVGGVRTLFRMPDLFSIALGGGTMVHDNATVGPLSVAYELFDKSISCGGDTLTTTDIMVATDKLDIGDKSKLKHLSQDFIDDILSNIKTMVTDSVDQIKSDGKKVPLLAVGGGACLIPDKIEGISEVVRVPSAGVANAVGAAMAQVSGYSDCVMRDMTREDAISVATELAKQDAIDKGANADTLVVTDVEDAPLTYTTGSNNLQVKIKVIGDIKKGVNADYSNTGDQ